MNHIKPRILTHLQGLQARHPGPYWASWGVAVVSMFTMVAAFGTAPSTFQRDFDQQPMIEQLSPHVELLGQQDEDYFIREERIQRGDTLASLFSRLGIQDEDGFQHLKEDPKGQVIFRQLIPGKRVSAHVTAHGELVRLIYPLSSDDKALYVERNGRHFQIDERTLRLEAQTELKTGRIQSSLFGATDAANIPDAIATQLAEIFAADIDFHRDLRKGDRFSVIYETYYHMGRPVRTGRILAAEFDNNGKTYRALWHDPNQDGKGSYYTADGKSLRKAFLRSPLAFSRISSGFTNARFHPVLKKWRAHKGVDYAAPNGTPVRATSDGQVEFVGSQGGYGNVVILRHQQKYTTLYGHMSRFAAGLKRGQRISQGDLIGYVGSTGWATGPHLHYEFRTNNVHQNPLSVALPTSIPLNPRQLADFRQSAQPYLAQLDQLGSSRLALFE